jgi:uncharacterized DUF497 family protein
MEIAFDPEKDAANIAKHGLSLADFKGFESEPQLRLDDRYDYAEIRYRAYGRIAGGDFCVVFTMRAATMRVISFRRAHDKEMRRYE